MPSAPEPKAPAQLTAAAQDGTSAAALLALAERVVHWEDDVRHEELHYYAALYAQAAHQTSRELAQLSGAPGQPRPTPQWGPDASLPALRSQLLQQRAHATALLAQLERARNARVKRPRYIYAVGALALLLLAAGASRAAYRPAVESFDLGNVSKKKPWRASSGATPAMPLHGTLDKPLGSYFFFTAREPEPWLEIDLQRATQIRGLKIVNRDDCCQDLAVPLVLEISVDRKHWKKLAEERTPFEVWRPRFAATSARWVRLRVQGESTLHLHSVVVRSL